MALEVTTHPEAQDEFDHALAYLEERSIWASDRLLEEYDRHVALIKARPTSYRQIYAEFRRINLKRFHYHIIYRARPDGIYVIAFAHDKRHPDYWKSRI